MLSSFAQEKSTVSGLVRDADGNPLPGVTVQLHRASDSSLLKVNLSNEKGNYAFDILKAGTYFLQLSATGFETASLPFEMTAPLNNQTLPELKLVRQTARMKEVVVSAKKPLIEVKPDRLVFNVESAVNATGSDAFELLRKSPGVQVDNNDNISLKGKSGVRVYVDGKMMQLSGADLAAYLRSLNSNDVEAIEMISNPSAKYDASGNAGIINIRLKKNKKFGTNGTATMGFVQGITPKGNAALNLNYRDKKVNVFGNVSGSLGIYHNAMDFYRIQKDTLYEQRSLNRNRDNALNTKIGLDWFINSRHTAGIMFTGNNVNNTGFAESNSPIYYQPTGQFIKDLQASNDQPGTRLNNNINLNYRYRDTSGFELNVDADHGIFRRRATSFQPNNYLDAQGALLYRIVNRNNTPTDIDINTFKADAEHRLKKGVIGYGIKYSGVRTDNTFDFFTDDATGTPRFDSVRSNAFTYDERVSAAYVNYQTSLGKKWSVQSGLRMEQTNSRGILTRKDGTVQSDDDVKRSYLDFFPSVALQFTANDKNSLNLTYSRRIDRPTYQDLNPFENKLDELTYDKGNAFLLPQYTNNIELSHTFMGIITTSASYSYVNNFTTQITDTIKNATYVQQRNLASQQVWSTSIGASTPIKPWWSGYATVYFNYQIINGSIGQNGLTTEIPTFGAYLQQQFDLGKSYTAEISGWYNGSSVWGATWRTRPQGALDIGIQKTLMNKNLTVKMSATDIFFTAPWKAKTDFGGLFVDGGGNWESRTFRLTLNWRFGSSQIAAARERRSGMESESKRIK
jgi:iron complex outermembrane receptor protein